MKSGKTLKIRIPSPCSENWDNMPLKGPGRHCSSCEKVIVDFTALSNQELLQYFLKTKTIPCGRFHHSQLDKNLAGSKRNKTFPTRLSAAFSTLLALSSIKPAFCTNLTAVPTTMAPVSRPQNDSTLKEVTISGTVTNDGRPLAGVKVQLDQVHMAITDSSGHFEFLLTPGQPSETHLLVFSYPLMVSIVRTYHASMESTSYNVAISGPKPVSCFTMGMPVLTDIPVMELYFLGHEERLNQDHKNQLDEEAQKLRENPDLIVKISGYIKKKEDLKKIKKWQVLVRDYLNNNQGISADRLKFDIIHADTGEQYLIQLLASSFDQ